MDSLFVLSERFGPPVVNLRQGRILDDHGSECCAPIEVDHRKPTDVTRKELEAYSDVWVFLKPRDLLFYLHPVATEFCKNTSLNCIDHFMYTFNDALPELQELLTKEEQNVLKMAFEEIWEAGGIYEADWDYCENLQHLIEFR